MLVKLRRMQRIGSVAQLNRASDYGSEGCGFESRRNHKRELKKLQFFFLVFLPKHKHTVYVNKSMPFSYKICNSEQQLRYTYVAISVQRRCTFSTPLMYSRYNAVVLKIHRRCTHSTTAVNSQYTKTASAA